jgi:integrase
MSVRQRTWKTAKGEERSAWIVQYIDPDGEDRIKTFKTKRAARDYAATTHTDIKKGTHIVDSQSITIAAAAEEWVKAVGVGRGSHGPAEASTLRQCRYHVDRYIVPKLGRLKLSRLSKERVMAFRDELLANVSRPLAKKVLTSLKGILSEAVERNRLVVNVASRVKIGDGGRGANKVTIPERRDVSAILSQLDEWADGRKAWRRWRALLATAIHTGMRASEIRGLPWESVDFKKAKITVTQRADENGVIGELKSKAAYRTINIPGTLVNVLRAWKLECPKGALAFANGMGNPESLANIYNRAWKPVQLAAGVADPKKDAKGNVLRDGGPIMEPRYNFHALRHFHASCLIADNANPKEIQAEMGHASIQITFNLYGHLFQDDEADKRRSERADRIAALTTT